MKKIIFKNKQTLLSYSFIFFCQYCKHYILLWRAVWIRVLRATNLQGPFWGIAWCFHELDFGEKLLRNVVLVWCFLGIEQTTAMHFPAVLKSHPKQTWTETPFCICTFCSSWYCVSTGSQMRKKLGFLYYVLWCSRHLLL